MIKFIKQILNKRIVLWKHISKGKTNKRVLLVDKPDIVCYKIIQGNYELSRIYAYISANNEKIYEVYTDYDNFVGVLYIDPDAMYNTELDLYIETNDTKLKNLALDRILKDM